MKKIQTAMIAAMLLPCLALTACSGVKNKGSVKQDDKNVFPISTHADSWTTYMGDVMPFYDNGVMNIYHLQDSKGSLSMFYHPISRLTTTDYVTYKDEGITLPFEDNKLDSPDAALGTGSFIKDADGNYHCFYTGHNSELEHMEIIRHAVSADGQQTWKKDEEFNLLGVDKIDFRDPYVYYDSTDECYYMLVTTRENNCGVIKQYKASSLSAKAEEWTDNGVFFKNDAGTYNMECPSYIELNGFKYLAYSEQGDNRVTHYRYQTADSDEWKKFDRDSIDSAGFYAGRLEKAGDKLLAFAWCARLEGGATGNFDWGGNLVAHEIKQAENGELKAVMIDSVKQAFSKKVGYKRVNGGKLTDLAFGGEKKLTAYGLEALSTNITRMNFTVQLDSLEGDFGMAFGIDGDYDNRLGPAVLAFKGGDNRISCYNNVANVLRYGSELTGTDYAFETGKEYNVDIIIDGEILAVYFDDTVALTTRFVDIQNKNFAFYSNGAKAQVKGITFYE